MMFKVRIHVGRLSALAKYLQGYGYYGIGIASNVDRYDEILPAGIVLYPQFKEFNVFW